LGGEAFEFWKSVEIKICVWLVPATPKSRFLLTPGAQEVHKCRRQSSQQSAKPAQSLDQNDDLAVSWSCLFHEGTEFSFITPLRRGISGFRAKQGERQIDI
jgi:hypothetical protein